ncbi:uncharacterized protein LOC143459890 isoform X2 [Clavelina lepadiformis]|uniref:uncharacterized protein LOC143459890 isoform X2 n=1 Tax=Clavelina lepadiformis TaxID=159417 RepID=UPI004041704D
MSFPPIQLMLPQAITVPTRPGQVQVTSEIQTVLQPDSFLKHVYEVWEMNVLVMAMNLKKFKRENLRYLDNCDQNLFVQNLISSLPDLQLGDLVKIKLKHRQFIQATEAGWNHVMASVDGCAGRVIGILPSGEMDAVVYFRNTDRSWIVSRSALEKCCQLEQCSECLDNSQDIPIGTDVQIDPELPKMVIKNLQASQSLEFAQVNKLRDAMKKIVAYDIKGTAIVSIDNYHCLHVHPALLNVSGCNDQHSASPSQPSRKYPLKKQVVLKKDIEKLIKLPLWNYQLTKILGCRGEVYYHGPGKQIGVKVNDTGYLITEEFIASTWKTQDKRRKRHASEGRGFNKSDLFPFQVDDILRLKMTSDPRFERWRKEQRIPMEYAKVLRDELYVVLGYPQPRVVLVRCGTGVPVRLGVPNRLGQFHVNELCPVSDEDKLCYKNLVEDTKLIKVGDEVAIYGAEHSELIKSILDLLPSTHLLTRELKLAMTSKAKLIAFDDDKDLAILEYYDKSLYSCPSTYIGLPSKDLDWDSDQPLASQAHTESSSKLLERQDQLKMQNFNQDQQAVLLSRHGNMQSGEQEMERPVTLFDTAKKEELTTSSDEHLAALHVTSPAADALSEEEEESGSANEVQVNETLESVESHLGD